MVIEGQSREKVFNLRHLGRRERRDEPGTNIHNLGSHSQAESIGEYSALVTIAYHAHENLKDYK